MVPALVDGMEATWFDCSWMSSDGLSNSELMLHILGELSLHPTSQAGPFALRKTKAVK